MSNVDINVNWTNVLEKFIEQFIEHVGEQLKILIGGISGDFEKFVAGSNPFLWVWDSWKTPFPAVLIAFFDAVSGRFANFRQQIVLFPLQAAVREELLLAFPVPPKTSQRVVTLETAYKMQASAIFDGITFFIVGLPTLPTPSAKLASGINTKIKIAYEAGSVAEKGFAAVSKAIGGIVSKSVLKTLLMPLLAIGALLAMVSMLNQLAERLEHQSKETLASNALTDKNPFTIKKQRHRVRDNPKLTTR